MDNHRETEDVPPEDRREQVLDFIVSEDIPLPPLAIYAGLKRREGITFAYRTVQNILSDLVERGHLFHVDTKALREGEIQPVEDSSGRRSYYMATEDGVEASNPSDQ